jgi:hypothetical protein
MKNKKTAKDLAKNEVIETEAMPEALDPESKEQASETETVENVPALGIGNDFTTIAITLQGLSVNGGDTIKELEMNVFEEGEIVVILHDAFVSPENTASALAQKLKENPNFFAIGIAPHKMSSLAHDAASGIATYPSISGGAVAFVAGNMKTTLRANNLASFWHYLAFNKPRGKQSGYIRVAGIGWELNKAYAPKSDPICKTC